MESTKKEIRQATDIVELVGADVPLRRAASNFVGHCPWCGDTMCSLHVNPSLQKWRCWSCREGGDVFEWVMRVAGVSFAEAKKTLAERAGLTSSEG